MLQSLVLNPQFHDFRLMGSLNFAFRFADFLQNLFISFFQRLFLFECFSVDVQLIEDVLVITIQSAVLLRNTIYFLLHFFLQLKRSSRVVLDSASHSLKIFHNWGSELSIEVQVRLIINETGFRLSFCDLIYYSAVDSIVVRLQSSPTWYCWLFQLFSLLDLKIR
jgi:hypothetical protein